MSDVAPVISLASARDARETSGSSGRSSSVRPADSRGEREALADPRLLTLLERIEACPRTSAGALVFGDTSAPRGMILMDDGAICWATARTIRGRLRRIVENESKDLGGALRAAGVVLERYANGDQQLGAVMHEHCAEAILEISRFDEHPAWFDRKRTYDARFKTRAFEVFIGLSRVARPDLSATAMSTLSSLGPGASGLAIARSGAQVAPRILAALDGADIGIARLFALGRWGESALSSAHVTLGGAHLVLSESRDHGTSATWSSGGIRFVAWAPDGRALTATLASNGII